MTLILGIDPGGEHTGLAYIIANPGTLPVGNAWEVVGLEAYDAFDLWIPRVDQVVCESFFLYEGKAKALIGNNLRVVERIGVARYLCLRHHKPLTEPPASQLKPAERQLKALGADRPKGVGPHACDAWTHAMAWGYRNVSAMKDGPLDPSSSAG